MYKANLSFYRAGKRLEITVSKFFKHPNSMVLCKLDQPLIIFCSWYLNQEIALKYFGLLLLNHPVYILIYRITYNDCKQYKNKLSNCNYNPSWLGEEIKI